MQSEEEIVRLRKEGNDLREKARASDRAILELMETREQLREQLNRATKQKEKLEQLCRSLHAQQSRSDADVSDVIEDAMAAGEGGVTATNERVEEDGNVQE